MQKDIQNQFLLGIKNPPIHALYLGDSNCIPMNLSIEIDCEKAYRTSHRQFDTCRMHWLGLWYGDDKNTFTRGRHGRIPVTEKKNAQPYYRISDRQQQMKWTLFLYLDRTRRTAAANIIAITNRLEEENFLGLISIHTGYIWGSSPKHWNSNRASSSIHCCSWSNEVLG